MRQTYDYEDNSGGLPIIYMALGVSVFVILVLTLVIMTNKKPQRNIDSSAVVTEEEDKESEETNEESKLVASDLDFWDMYPIEEEPVEEEKDTEEDKAEEEPVVTGPENDGKHVEVVFRDGTNEWVPINPYRKKHTYDFTNLVSKNNLLHYYSDGKQVSYLGIDLSKYQKNVDFAAIQAEGIDYCMIRVGSRGYSTGVISQDEMFDSHMAGAAAVGMPVGLYFYSQAVTEAEAVEEANYVISKIGQYKITYPIAFDMEFVENDTARIETLTRDEKTNIALAFLKRIEEAGYAGMLYGNKEWLLKRIDIAKLEQYDIWLAEEEDIPDYPYLFSMWQYTRQGQIFGIDGYVDLNVSFIDYSAR